MNPGEETKYPPDSLPVETKPGTCISDVGAGTSGVGVGGGGGGCGGGRGSGDTCSKRPKVKIELPFDESYGFIAQPPPLVDQVPSDTLYHQDLPIYTTPPLIIDTSSYPLDTTPLNTTSLQSSDSCNIPLIPSEGFTSPSIDPIETYTPQIIVGHPSLSFSHITYDTSSTYQQSTSSSIRSGLAKRSYEEALYDDVGGGHDQEDPLLATFAVPTIVSGPSSATSFSTQLTQPPIPLPTTHHQQPHSSNIVYGTQPPQPAIQNSSVQASTSSAPICNVEAGGEEIDDEESDEDTPFDYDSVLSRILQEKKLALAQSPEVLESLSNILRQRRDSQQNNPHNPNQNPDQYRAQ